MGDNTYNGWTNWETWNFKLWADNDEGTHEWVLEMGKNKDAYEYSEELKEWAFEMLEESELRSGFLSDVCHFAIKEVNFFQIAKSYLEELEGEEA